MKDSARLMTHRSALAAAIATILMLSLLLAPASRVAAATVVVADGDVQGLIDAIQAANADPDQDIIQISGSFSFADANPVDGRNALPVITTDITIEGTGNEQAVITKDFNSPILGNLRYFEVGQGGASPFATCVCPLALLRRVARSMSMQAR